ncbi:SDR family NAD(P)-dependent oxidoreductase [Paremcibacter congregatus]|uniref:SDR family NAD(P)-dependent oxidoreductase n=1 Tax=Paremcibacter congregatus TaxID=2043170 RepID=UPI0011247083|nr:SDR family NAD(P)-dependent oxidoreductase [Paremcibacter congregatus]QDE27627.1 SDR family NAD(P)-dependent oxidoreductase [Paremcibacter congregatus]
MTITFKDKVALVTGGGNGLGREYCLALAGLGARVVVNDLGGTLDGSRGDAAQPASNQSTAAQPAAALSAAEKVAAEIRSLGGEAIASTADITDYDQVKGMTEEAMNKWGRIDILINNAGILRDKTFSKMSPEDFQKVVDVHLFGTMNCTKLVWDIMKAQGYGRILLTSSSSGLFGNFGQSNYGAAKAAMVGLMNVLHHEGAKYDIRVNCLAPTAATRMLDGLLPEKVEALMAPKLVAPGALYLVSDEAPSKTILGAGAGSFSVIRISETPGVFLGGEETTVDDVAKNWATISNPEGQTEMAAAFEQTNKFVELAAKSLGITLTTDRGR